MEKKILKTLKWIDPIKKLDSAFRLFIDLTEDEF